MATLLLLLAAMAMFLDKQALMPNLTASTNSLQDDSSDMQNAKAAPENVLMWAMLVTDQHDSLRRWTW
jgi:hypothetical protein